MRRLLPRRRRGWLWVALSFGIALNGLRLRQHLSGLVDLAVADPPDSVVGEDEFLLVKLPGVVVDDETRSAAVAHARAQQLDVLDLVPGDLPLARALDLAPAIDTTTFRSAPFAAGRGALHALLIRGEIWDRMGMTATDAEAGPSSAGSSDSGWDRAELVGLTERLKHYGPRSTDLAVAPRLHALDVSAEQRLDELRVMFDRFAPVAVAIPVARQSLLLAGLALSPGWAAVAVAGFVLQPYLVTAGAAFHPRDRLSLGTAVGRILAPFALAMTAINLRKGNSGNAGNSDEDPIEARRPDYTVAVAEGLHRFFEDRRTTCPWCGGAALTERIRTGDLLQFKPGEFVLDECTDCGVIFQNPRLSIDGLDFYYRDFYDGLGTGEMEFLFAQSAPFYRARVDLVHRHVSPKSWLDVGTGYGHFCLSARGVLPETRFDGLDMGVSIDEGQRRGWIDHGYRGLLPEIVSELTERYDVVSMLHYLEHTRDPRREIDAAHAALASGGHLLIEVPDPECSFGRLLGRYWVPWLQPQHQQFLPVANLCSALESQGFSVVDVEHCPAHPLIDLASALWMWSGSIAPPPRLPWRDDPNASQQLQRLVVLGSVGPVVVAAIVGDQLVPPLIGKRALRWSNAYRVLARRR
jgi:SAM-dependent methyltransferase